MRPLNKYIDHTLLSADATAEQIKNLCREAVEYDFCAVCINSYNIPIAVKELKDTDIKIACTIGFPLGAMSTNAKVYEAETACSNGADEIDMVMNIGALKSDDYEEVRNDIAKVKKTVYEHDGILKVILETCLLSKEEIILACGLAVEAGADFVKTSTGFSKGGAREEDVALMKKSVSGEAYVKASGGIRDKTTAEKMIRAGADRLGCSASVKIMNE